MPTEVEQRAKILSDLQQECNQARFFFKKTEHFFDRMSLRSPNIMRSLNRLQFAVREVIKREPPLGQYSVWIAGDCFLIKILSNEGHRHPKKLMLVSYYLNPLVVHYSEADTRLTFQAKEATS